MCNTNIIPEESEDKSTDSESEESYTDEGNEQYRLPPNLEPYMAQLNHLAQNDLNFQNLLLMYLVTTLPGLGGNGQADNQTSSQIRDLLVDMISSAVKTQSNEEETCFPVPVQPTSDLEALAMLQSPPTVVGYPAPDLNYCSPSMGLNNYSMRECGFGMQPLYQYHGGWMPTYQNQWNGGEQTIAGLMHSGALQMQGGSNIREMKDEDVYGNEHRRPQINYESDLMNNSHSNSSPASINDFTSEGFLSEGESFEGSETYSDSL